MSEASHLFIQSLQGKLRSRAVIREAECIGCTKCIQACPVDSILGAAKEMHTVISSECTGCELCVEPCPVDCIEMVLHPVQEKLTAQQITHYEKRFEAREARLQKKPMPLASLPLPSTAIDAKKAYVNAAVLRARLRKSKSSRLG